MREYEDSAEEEGFMPVGFSSCFEHQSVCSTEFSSCMCISYVLDKIYQKLTAVDPTVPTSLLRLLL